MQVSAVLGCHKSAVSLYIDRPGKLRRRTRRRAVQQLKLGKREEISRGVAAGDGVRAIARRVGRALASVSRELARHDVGAVRPAPRAPAHPSVLGVSPATPIGCTSYIGRVYHDTPTSAARPPRVVFLLT